jgi:predicted alpha-1,2-mannosidase
MRTPRTLRRPLLGLLAAATVMSVATLTGVAPGAAAVAPSPDLARYVNPFVGTAPGAADYGTGGGAGNTFPGADVPFGMVQWSPDTVSSQPGGYYYPDNRIKGFSLTHLSGAGCYTYQDVPFMPYVGTVTASPATSPGQYVSTFSHANESATAGSYRLQLDNGVTTELAATRRTGVGRFVFPAAKPATMLVNVSGSVSGADDAQVTIGRNSISGWVTSGHFCGAGDTYRVHFYATFDAPFAAVGTWHNGVVSPGTTQGGGGAPAKVAAIRKTAAAGAARGTPGPATAAPQDTTVTGPGSGAYVTFDTSKGTAITAHVGLSFVSVANAQANVQAESAHDDLPMTRDKARKEWNARLGAIRVQGGTDDQRTTFYTALYHAFLQPNVFSDVNGQYPGFDGLIHTAGKGHAEYTNFSGWDIYRSEAQLLALVAPHEASDIARTMSDFAGQGGSWDRWTVANDYTGVMVGDPYPSIVASMYAFGATDFDAATALQRMVKGATQPTAGYAERPGLADYLKLGYVPTGEQGVWGPTATTLEYTTADFGIAQLAARLGQSATYDQFMKRAQYWENLFNPANGYLQPRNRDGSFVSPFDPARMDNYVEGNGAQYTWMVPYDLRGLFNAMGGDAKVLSRLDSFFTKLNGGPQEPYAFLGNEPTLETPWAYAYAGAPYRTQDVVRRATNTIYTSGPGGYVGNDDLGEMSSWYVWAALGMYPEAPGRAELVLASPLFPAITVTRPSGQTITINAPGASADTYYVHGLAVNGKATTHAWLPESFVNTGGTLDYTIAGTPDTVWGSAPADAPPSFRNGEIPFSSFTSPSRIVVAPGTSGSSSIGAQSISGDATTVSWTAQPPTGLTLSPASGTFGVPAGGAGSQPVTVQVAAGTPDGFYSMPFSLKAADGTALPGTTLSVVVAQPGSLLAAYDNAGISEDSDQASANFDGVGFSYSAQALAAAGLTAGAQVTAGGGTFTWPNVPPGSPDNVVAAGQTLDVKAAAGGQHLYLLGSATNGNTSGTLTITYTDGSTSTATVGFSDWTLGGNNNPVAYGNVLAAKSAYRNSTSGSSQTINTYVFVTAPIALDTTKTIKSITLPNSGGRFHVFDVVTG